MALNKSELNLVGTNTLKTILQLVRYDIPTLIVGKSSIGKSYTIIEITEKWRLPSSILYIGSEKPENIEGLAKLISGDYETKKDAKGKTTQKGEDILKFLKPYWFPNSNTISTQVANGQRIFDNYIKIYDKPSTKFSYSYSILHQILISLMNISYPANENSITANLVDRSGNNLSNITGAPEILNSKAFEFKRSEETEIQSTTAYEFTLDTVNAGRDDIRDMCMYLCTLLGYGNYWLILDELDKVSENDTDKYAPLLHIVRERTLKSWTMKEINDKKGMPIPSKVDYGSYRSMADLIRTQISKGLPLLDCRIIGIANETKNIEEALFRRFCQIIMRSTMSLYPPNEEVNKVMTCVNENSPNRMNIDKLLRKVAFLDEVNLQWQYSFLPKMLNRTDTDGNFIYQNFNTYFKDILKSESGNFSSAQAKLEASGDVYTKTSWGMIWRDNYMGGSISNDSSVQELYKDLAKLFLCLAEELYLQEESNNISAIAGSTKVGGGTLSPLMRLRIEITKAYAEQKSLYFDGLEIALGESYGETIGNPSALANWTTNALNHIEASNVDDAGNYDQISEVGDRMIPFIYQQLMINFRSENSLDTDSFNAQLLIIDEFFSEFLNKQTESEIHSIKSDKEQTEKLMFGESKKILKGMKPLQRKEVEKESLYGKDFYNSLSYSIYKRFYLQGVLTMFIETTLNENEKFIGFLQNDTYGKQFLGNPKVKNILEGYYDSVPDTFKESTKGQRLKDIINYLNA